MPAFEFDQNAMPPERIKALEAAVNVMADAGPGDVSDERLKQIEANQQLFSAALKDLDRRQADLYAKVASLTPPATAPSAQDMAAKAKAATAAKPAA